MRILIIGWYGTETIGDRAILAGILSQLRQTCGEQVEIVLGSLFPFFSERTIGEDRSFYQTYSNCSFPIEIISSKDIHALEKQINACDMVVMGGGPLMHISQLYIIEYAFKYAKKKKKSTIIYGCGIGPMHKKRFVRSLRRLLNHADEIILRDAQSVEYLKKLYGKTPWALKVAIDPAVQAVMDYRAKTPGLDESPTEPAEKYIAVNLRKFPTLYGQENISDQVHRGFEQLLSGLAGQTELRIDLVPMHYFHVGDDDRDILNELRFRLAKKNIAVQNVPLSLEGTLKKFQDAEACIGMRFHSVLFQSLINGNNFVLDYTEPEIGKISGFLDMIDETDFYKSRYISLRNAQPADFNIDLSAMKDSFTPDEEKIRGWLDIYSKTLARYT